MSADHAPTPWKLCHHLSSHENDTSCRCGYRGGIWGSDGEHIVCEMGSQPTPGQEGMEPPRYARPVELANAAFIVRAANSHDALIEALEPFAKLADKFDLSWEDGDSLGLDEVGRFHDISVGDLRRARAALKLASAS